MSTYGDKRDYPKIHILTAHNGPDGRYFAYHSSTTWARTCKEAKQKFYEAKYPAIPLADIKCRFAKG